MNNKIEVHIFHGEFCHPCHEALPLLKNIENIFMDKYPLNINFHYYKMEDCVDDVFNIYHITGVPTIIIKQSLDNKSVCIYRWIGMPSTEDMISKLEYFINTTEKIETITLY